MRAKYRSSTEEARYATCSCHEITRQVVNWRHGSLCVYHIILRNNVSVSAASNQKGGWVKRNLKWHFVTHHHHRK